jgi:hypothetical protein
VGKNKASGNDSKLNLNAREFTPKQSRRKFCAGKISYVDSSLYTTGEMNDIQTPILLDTGAALTVISAERWKNCAGGQNKLQRVEGSLHSATGMS